MIYDIEYKDIIDSLVKKRFPFAFYRKPGGKIEFIVQSSDKVSQIKSIADLEKQSGYVMAPFTISPDEPIVVIHPDCTNISDLKLLLDENLLNDKPSMECLINFNDECRSKIQYSKRFNLFIEALKSEAYDKLVLSRKQYVNWPQGMSMGKIFIEACNKYIRSYVYICYTPQSGLWLGATPEIILSKENEFWHTVALAGTQSLVGGLLPTRWDEKNREEQAYVSDYVRKILNDNGEIVKEKGPYIVQAGALAHLKTDFYFKIKNRSSKLLNLLHPTPAVCGVPKNEAYNFILSNEGYNRSYYSGFTGVWNCNGHTNLYVNLRCMQCVRNVLAFYMGGGILNSSEMNKEWDETVLKMQTMRSIIPN